MQERDCLAPVFDLSQAIHKLMGILSYIKVLFILYFYPVEFRQRNIKMIL